MSGDNRTAAILAPLVLDRLLKHILIGSMRQLSSDEEETIFGGRGILASFSTRITLASALELIDADITHDLELVRLVRNAFAHSDKAITFESEPIRLACDDLLIFNHHHLQKPDDYEGVWPPVHPRERYVQGTFGLANWLSRVAYPELDWAAIDDLADDGN